DIVNRNLDKISFVFLEFFADLRRAKQTADNNFLSFGLHGRTLFGPFANYADDRSHSRKRRSIFCALSKFLAASSPIGSISLVEARSAPLKSVPLTVMRASVAPLSLPQTQNG